MKKEIEEIKLTEDLMKVIDNRCPYMVSVKEPPLRDRLLEMTLEFVKKVLTEIESFKV